MFALKFKRGGSFIFTGPILINNAVSDKTGWLISAAIAQRVSNGTTEGGVGALITVLPATWLNPVLAMAQIGDIAVNTYGWPIGPAVIDIKLTTPAGVVILTDTQLIEITGRVTP